MSEALILPDSLEQYRPWAEPTQERLAKMSLANFVDQMPPLRRSDDGTGYIILPPVGENGKATDQYDRDHAILLNYSYMNNHWPNYIMRARSIQGVIHTATGAHVQIVGFPSTTSRKSGGLPWRMPQEPKQNYFTSEELWQISVSDFRPYAERHGRVVEKLHLSSIDLFGTSFGGVVALTNARYMTEKAVVNVKSSTHIDPATLHARKTEKDQAFDFVRSIGPSFDAARDSGVPAYTNAQEAGLRYLPGQVVGTISGAIGDLRLAEMTAIRTGMARGGFTAELDAYLQLENAAPVTLAAGKGSKITDKGIFDSILHHLVEKHSLPYGHALTNHMSINGIIAALTYKRARQ